MAKVSSVQNNKKRIKISNSLKKTRTEIKTTLKDRSLDFDARLSLVHKLAEMPRNSSPVRVRNRCLLTGRPRGFYRRFKLSRIALRELANSALIPGLTKASW